jgi:hypothetical protein
MPPSTSVPRGTDDQAGTVEPGKVRVALMIREDIDRAMEIEAARRNITKSQLVMDALNAYF